MQAPESRMHREAMLNQMNTGVATVVDSGDPGMPRLVFMPSAFENGPGESRFTVKSSLTRARRTVEENQRFPPPAFVLDERQRRNKNVLRE
ncbi:hypothetical protein DACRYDRAFT_23643, partial [Dacryopinax primogenitus]